MWKKKQIVMIPSINKSNGILINTNIDPVGFGNLYVIDDEEITYNPNGGTDGLFLCLHELEHPEDAIVRNVGNCAGCREIIASTDNLEIAKDVKSAYCNNHEIIGCNIPRIPDLFIDYYIMEYDNGHKIMEVEVEYWDNCNYTKGNCIMTPQTKPCVECEYWYPIIRLSHDNTINIKITKSVLYTEEDLKSFAKFCKDYISSSVSYNFIKWTEQNKKK